MTKTTFMLVSVGIYLFTIAIAALVLFLIDKRLKKKYTESINELEREKNLIISPSIINELNKVESLVNNEDLKKQYEEWKARLNEIKEIDIKKITDHLNEVQVLYDDRQDKKLKESIIELEMEVNVIKSKAESLLGEIREITLSEERNREKITRLKAEYRTIRTTYKENINDYKKVKNPIELQFENVDKLFSNFESAMDKNAYVEVGKIVKAIDSIIANLRIVIDETKTICQYGDILIPKKIKDIKLTADKLTQAGFNIEYLNIDYNIEETKKKIQDIFDRLNVLDVEDSVFELKTLLDYFDSLYNDFEKETSAKESFDKLTSSVIIKCSKIDRIATELYKKIDEIKYNYAIEQDDINSVLNIKKSVNDIKEAYERTIDNYRTKILPYSKLNHDMEILNERVLDTDGQLNNTLTLLTNLKDDEERAKKQREEIQEIIVQTKEKEKESRMPIIPKQYYVEYEEAIYAIKEMINELEKKPLSIKTLNLRVDTARDLVLKVYKTINETDKASKLAESAIVYGNRYRAVNKDVDQGLTKAENLFYKGNYSNSLTQAINTIDIVEPGIYDKILNSFTD